MTDEPKSAERAEDRRSAVERLVMRFVFAFVHIWLAVTHFWDLHEAQQFFADERDGRNRRLKRAAIKAKFPDIGEA